MARLVDLSHDITRYADGVELSGLALERCADLPLVVVPVHASTTAITKAALADVDVEGCAVLFATGWSRHRGSERYLAGGHPYLAAGAVSALIEGGAVLVGIDSSNVDDTGGERRPAHASLLAAGIPIVEHLTNLDLLPARGARFTAAPPKLAGLGTFTVRAFASLPSDAAHTRAAVCEVVIDCADPARLAEFWTHVIGGVARVRSDDWASVRDPRPGGLMIGFQRVPEPKKGKNRVHIDVWSDDLAADTARLVAAGAARQGDVVVDEMGGFQVLLDVEGNEFCLVD